MKNLVQELHEKAKEIAQRFRRAESDLIDVLQDLEKHRVYLQLGFTSLFQYAVGALGLSESNASNFITVARKAREVPQIKEEIKQGRITVHKARKITSVINKNNSQDWLQKAKTLPLRKLEKEVARENPQEAVPEKTKFITAERMELTMGISEEIMEKLKRAQNVLSQKKKKAVSLEEVLDQTLDLYLHKEDPLEKAKRNAGKPPRNVKKSKNANLHVPGHTSWQSYRPAISSRTKHRVMLRDKGQCAIRGCSNQRHLEMHHIIPVSRGGEHQVDNLELLCSSHHRMRHRR